MLGAKVGTKLNREQFATADKRSMPIIAMLIDALYASTPVEAMLSGVQSVGAYGRLLMRAQDGLKVRGIRWTPHSPRVGFATELRLQGFDFQEIKERGRWSSDRSLRGYLDVTAVAMASLRLESLKPLAVWLEEDFARRYPWWPA